MLGSLFRVTLTRVLNEDLHYTMLIVVTGVTGVGGYGGKVYSISKV